MSKKPNIVWLGKKYVLTGGYNLIWDFDMVSTYKRGLHGEVKLQLIIKSKN